MSHVVDGLYYTRDHIWIMVEDEQATIGLTDFGQIWVGDVTMVELPEDDRKVHCGDEVASIQGRDGDLPVNAPVSGKVIEVNQELENSPETINQDCYGIGWLFKVDMSNPSELDRWMEAEAYEEFLAREEDE